MSLTLFLECCDDHGEVEDDDGIMVDYLSAVQCGGEQILCAKNVKCNTVPLLLLQLHTSDYVSSTVLGKIYLFLHLEAQNEHNT